MKKAAVSDNRGSYLARSWDDIRKAGGLAPPIDVISNYLHDGGETDMAQLTRQQVTDKIVEYFKSVTETCVDSDSGEIVTRWTENPTKSGLAMALGVCTDTLTRYLNNERNGGTYSLDNSNSYISPADFDLLRKASTIIESFYESRLGLNQNNSGSIFWLLNKKNNHWSNQQQIVVEHDNSCLRSDRTPEQIEADIPIDIDEFELGDE